MQELTVENDGAWGAPDNPGLTHLVVNDHTIKELPQNMELPPFVVRVEVGSLEREWEGERRTDGRMD